MRSAGRSFGGLNPGPRLLRDYSDAAGVELSLKVSSEFVRLTGLRSHSPCASKSGVSSGEGGYVAGIFPVAGNWATITSLPDAFATLCSRDCKSVAGDGGDSARDECRENGVRRSVERRRNQGQGATCRPHSNVTTRIRPSHSLIAWTKPPAHSDPLRTKTGGRCHRPWQSVFRLGANSTNAAHLPLIPWLAGSHRARDP